VDHRRSDRGLDHRQNHERHRVWGHIVGIIGPVLFRGFDSKSKIAKIRAPLLFFHGERDEIISLKLGRSLFDDAPEPKCFIEVPGAGHNDLLERAGSTYRERLHEFYGQIQQ
jgi:fermentation-respiration switch protein FrsA (DUF1100 family)